jgi:hypothetical protein
MRTEELTERRSIWSGVDKLGAGRSICAVFLFYAPTAIEAREEPVRARSS